MRNFLILTILILFPLISFSQSVDGGGSGGDILDYLMSFGTFVAAIPLLIDFLNSIIKLSGLPLQILSWCIGLVMGILAHFLGLGIFAELSLLSTLLVSIGASLAANGLADTGLIRTILNLIPGIHLRSFKSSK